jgi:hypothetical protein
VKEYCGCSICEENEKQGGQGKDRGKIKSGGLRKVGDHGGVYDFNEIII